MTNIPPTIPSLCVVTANTMSNVSSDSFDDLPDDQYIDKMIEKANGSPEIIFQVFVTHFLSKRNKLEWLHKPMAYKVNPATKLCEQLLVELSRTKVAKIPVDETTGWALAYILDKIQQKRQTPVVDCGTHTEVHQGVL